MKLIEIKPLYYIFTIIFWTTLSGILLTYLSPFVNPSKFVYVALFGLFYPVILAISVIVLFFCLLQKQWKRFFLLVLILLVGAPFHFRYFSFGKKTANNPKTSIEIMSYNVRLFDLYNWNNTKNYAVRDSIFNFLAQKNPDIICFQEFYYSDSTKFKTKDTLQSLLKATNFYGQFTDVDHKKIGRQHFGIATFSRYPILNKGIIDLHSAVSNFCIYTDVEKTGKIIRIYNAHIGSVKFQQVDYALFDEKKDTTLPNFEKKSNLIGKLFNGFKIRSNEIQQIMRHAKKSPYPVIICGDLNDTPISFCYEQLHENFTDAFLESGFGVGTTYSGKIPPNRIDYIFHGKEFISTEFHVQKNVFSDHRAIWTRVNLLK